MIVWQILPLETSCLEIRPKQNLTGIKSRITNAGSVVYVDKATELQCVSFIIQLLQVAFQEVGALPACCPIHLSLSCKVRQCRVSGAASVEHATAAVLALLSCNLNNSVRLAEECTRHEKLLCTLRVSLISTSQLGKNVCSPVSSFPVRDNFATRRSYCQDCQWTAIDQTVIARHPYLLWRLSRIHPPARKVLYPEWQCPRIYPVATGMQICSATS